MSHAEYVDKVFAGCDPNNTGRFSTSALLPVFQASLKATGSDKVLTQEDVDKGLAKIQLSEPGTINREEFLQLISLGGVN